MNSVCATFPPTPQPRSERPCLSAGFLSWSDHVRMCPVSPCFQCDTGGLPQTTFPLQKCIRVQVLLYTLTSQCAGHGTFPGTFPGTFGRTLCLEWERQPRRWWWLKETQWACLMQIQVLCLYPLEGVIFLHPKRPWSYPNKTEMHTVTLSILKPS
jgi:hypothetical protein